MDDIFLLQSDQRAAAVLIGALDPSHRVRSVVDFEELEVLLQSVAPQACILDLFDPPPSIPFTALRRLRRNHPTVALIIASDFDGREMDLYHLGRLSVDGVIRMDALPSARDILAVVDGAIAASLATLVVLSNAEEIPPLAQEAIRWAIEHAETRPQVSELAAALALSPRALIRAMKALNLVSPRLLLLWGRLIRASHLLERSSETVESVAFHLGYATGGALGKALKRHVGCSPTKLLERGGLAWTLEVFRRQGLRPAK
ncbi:MAG: AraC family transcriptional regulator [Gemmatimonadota bacterium]